MGREIKIVIPARYGSSRLPGKPLLDICGKQMIVRVCERVRDALIDTQIIVATDDQRIVDVVRNHGYDAIMTSSKHVSGTDRIAEVANILKWKSETIVINLQGDEPLIDTKTIKTLHEFIAGSKTVEMVTVSSKFNCMTDVKDTNRVKVVTSPSGRAIYFSRSPIPFVRNSDEVESLSGMYKRHLGIYAYTVGVLKTVSQLPPTTNELAESLEQLRAIDNGIKIQVLDTYCEEYPSVDTSDDLERTREKYKEIYGLH